MAVLLLDDPIKVFYSQLRWAMQYNKISVFNGGWEFKIKKLI